MTGGICAICHKPAVEAYKPFCSKRCADIDLAHWLGGTYAIPADSGQKPEDSHSESDEISDI